MRKLSHITILDEYAVDMDIVLGQGSTGCVYQGLNMKNSRKVAIKIIDLRTIDNEVADYLLRMERIAIMAVDSQYVLKGLKVAEDNHYCFLITQFCNGGTLKRKIKGSPLGYLPQEQALNIISQILRGYRALVEKGIVHRDLKPANIMLHDQVPKIIDFGYCQIKGYAKPSLEYNVGSPSYMAPQSFQKNIYNEKTEIWAIGVILFQCVTGRTIDEGRHMSEVYHEIEVSGIPFPVHVSYYVRNIINWCLSKNPKNRPTCQQLLETYFGFRTRSRSKLSPFKTDIQNSKKNFLDSHISTGDLKLVKHKSPNQIKEDHLFKSTRVENKSKSYKMPQFLQASTKLSSKMDQKENIFNPYQTERQEIRKIRPSKSGKIYRNDTIGETKLKMTPLSSNWQYGGTDIVKTSSKLFQQGKKIDVDEMYRKICKNGGILTKNRVVSTQLNVSPSQKLTKSPYKVPSGKEFVSRTKRTMTDRMNMIRA